VVKIICCVMYDCGSSPTEVILWLETCRILIAQAREKRLWWISYGYRLSTTSKWSGVKVCRLCYVPLRFKSYRSHFVIQKLLSFNYTILRKRLRWICCDRLSTTSKLSSGKDYMLCNVPLWFKSSEISCDLKCVEY
jgi:hypothetical protein